MNSPILRGLLCGRAGRKGLAATAFLAASLCLGVAAFAQDSPDAPPPPPSDQQSAQPSGQPSGPPSEQGMGRRMGHHPMMSVDDQINHLSKKLSLSDEQKAKLTPILEDQRKQMEAVHNDSSLSREDRFGKMQELRKSSDDQIKAILNPDQQKNFDKMREEQRDRMKNWRKGGEGAPPAGDSQ